MTTQKPSMTEQQIRIHLDRAKEFGVTASEYAEAYGVDLKALTDSKIKNEQTNSTPLAINDFVKVDVLSRKHNASPVCSISHPSGWTLECNEWPPAAWLHSLKGAAE